MQINNMFLGMNPDVYARQYAIQNNTTVDDAKTKLQEQYGTPNKQDESIFTSNKIDSNSSFDFSDLDEFNFDDDNANNFSISELFQNFLGLFGNNTSADNSENPFADDRKAPDDYAQEYATEHNLSLDEAKAELKEKYGEPDKKN